MSTASLPVTESSTHLPKFAFIDALRGVAVILVIASHSFPVLHSLPWGIKRLTNLGYYGVQLFFVVSCLTLAASWRSRLAMTGQPPSLRDFAIRRVLRIVPAYFLAALFYFVLLPAPNPDWLRIATFATFTSGWSPGQMPTVAPSWIGVPGGWSIEAEMAFYALFPLLIRLRGVAAPLAAAVLSLPFAWVVNGLAHKLYLPIYGEIATDQFLYYWLPNQIGVFLLGLAAYAACGRVAPGGAWARAGDRIARHWPALLMACGLAFAALGYLRWPRLPLPNHGFVPIQFMAAAVFGSATLVCSRATLPRSAWLLGWIGQASFSAYLLHFAVIEGVQAVLPARIVSLYGMAAVAAGACVFLVVLGVTALAARLTYRFIEQPGIAAASDLSSWVSGAAKA